MLAHATYIPTEIHEPDRDKDGQTDRLTNRRKTDEQMHLLPAHLHTYIAEVRQRQNDGSWQDETTCLFGRNGRLSGSQQLPCSGGKRKHSFNDR